MNENNKKNTPGYANTKGYGFNKIVSANKTDEFLENGGLSIDRVIDYNYRIRTLVNLLKHQGRVFGMNFKTHGAYNFEKLFGCGYDTSVQLLTEMYIYSYFKALYSIYFDTALPYEDNGGYCFDGHSRFYAINQRKSYLYTEENVSLSMKINLGSVKYRCVDFSVLINQFGFFKKYINELPILGEGPFIIARYELLFSKLVNDFYAKRAGGEPDFMQVDVNDYKDGKNTKKILAKENEVGDIQITTLKNEASMKIREKESNPLMNTFYSGDCNSIYHLEVNGNFVVKYNESFFFPLANFFSIDERTSDMKNIKRYYKKTELTSSQYFLTNSDVYTITGIKPRITLPYEDDFSQIVPFNLPPGGIQQVLDDASEKLSKVEDVVSIITEIVDRFTEGKDDEGK
jgi:hypothetical protein